MLVFYVSYKRMATKTTDREVEFAKFSSKLGAMRPPELQVSPEDALLRHIFSKRGAAKGVISSMEYWIDNILPQQIANRPLKTKKGLLYFLNARVDDKPTMMKQGKRVALTPMTAQNTEQTYQSSITAEPYFQPFPRYDSGTGRMFTPAGVKGVNGQQTRIEIGQLPIMKRSKFCHLGGMTDDQLIEAGECPNDPGGYFVVKGTPRVITIQEKLRFQLPLTYYNPMTSRVETRYTYSSTSGSSVVIVSIGKRLQSLKVGSYHLRDNHKLNIYVAYFMLAVEPAHIWQWYNFFNTSDPTIAASAKEALKQIFEYFTEMILKFCEPDQHFAIRQALQTSIYKAFTIDNFVMYMTRKFAAQVPALSEESITASYTIMRDNFLADMFEFTTDVQDKAHVFAFMCANTIKQLLGFRLLDDRDTWANKKLDDAARMMEQVLGLYWNQIITNMTQDMVSGKYEIEENPMSGAIIPKSVFSTASTIIHRWRSFIADEFASSFRPGYWGVRGNQQRNNVTDSLKAETPIAAFSQVSHVNIPSSRKAKVPLARMIKGSELGLMCPAETPDGEGVGLIKNKTIGCEISMERSSEQIDTVITQLAADGVINTDLATGHQIGWYPFYCNGRVRGWCRPPTKEETVVFGVDILKRPILPIEHSLKFYRHRGYLPIDSLIFFNRRDSVMEFACDGGRPTRYLLVVAPDGQLVIDSLVVDGVKGWDCEMEVLMRNGALALVDAREQEFAMIAEFTKDVRDRYERRIKLHTINTHREAFDANVRRNVGSVASVIPGLIQQNYLKFAANLYGYYAAFAAFTKTEFNAKDFESYFYNILDVYQNGIYAEISRQSCEAGDKAINLEAAVKFANILATRASHEGVDKLMRSRNGVPKLRNADIDAEYVTEVFSRYNYDASNIEQIITNVLQGYRTELDEMESKIPYQYSEIHPVQIMGISGSLEPRPDCEQGPRTTYQASMVKQALGFYSYNRHNRFDKSYKVLLNPQRPIGETIIAEPAGLNTAPTGAIAIVAFIAMQDGNEDAITIKKEYIECNNLEMMKLTRHSASCSQTNGEYFQCPDIRPGEPEGRYAAIDKNGIAKPDSYVRQGDCIIGRIKVDPKTGAVINMSIYAGLGEEGYVDRVIIVTNNKEERIVKVMIRKFRRNGEGDKLSSRYAQKGTISRIIPAKDLPRIIGGPNHGLVPDIIINPHSIPSRMTMGLLMEMLGSKAAVYLDERFDMTAFSEFNIKMWRDRLRALGMEQNGNETMMWPNGKILDRPIFVGPCFYQVLRHHVADKIQFRGRGAIRPHTHQPVGGRLNGGGQRLGEMERDALISHAATGLVLERLMLVSDAYKVVFCQCGRIAVSDVASGTNWCNVCSNKVNFYQRTIPYVLKLMFHMLMAIGIEPTVRLGELSHVSVNNPEFTKYVSTLE